MATPGIKEHSNHTSVCPGYRASQISSSPHGLKASLTLNGTPCDIYGNDIQELVLTVALDSPNYLRIHIEDIAGKQYQIPNSVIQLNKYSHMAYARHNTLKFSHSHDSKSGFGFKVFRQNEIIFDTVGHPLIFEDQYIEITSSLPENANIYGIGETPDWFRRDPNNTTMTLWNRDAPDPFRENVYGSHTVYMELRENGHFHGAYLHNSHGMDIVLRNKIIQYRVLGGTADLYFFGGPTALDVISQYTELVGRPSRIPYWSLGFHNCRYGYKSTHEVNEVIANYTQAKIPLEVAWTDIDYMDRERDFTFNPANFSLQEMRAQLDYLHAHDQKMILIIDPAIQFNSTYGTYARGHSQNVFIKNADGSEYIGQVWPGHTTFPDWFAANVSSWWSDELRRYFDALPIDGMWIDMNEASSFCTGSCGSGKPKDEVPHFPWTIDNPPPPRPLDKSNRILVPPYAIHNPEMELSTKTIETTAVHANGVIEYHVHNLYGYMESKLTYEFMTSYRRNKRAFLLSRSTFAGSGALVSHWTGDNWSTWHDLHVSIATVFDFGIFGIPMVGADICGFIGNATEELCARWIELGAFYPFSRVHNSIDMKSQEIYRWDTVAEAGRRALAVRYALLPYIYSCYQEAVERGWPVARPLVFEFPTIQDTVDNDRQLLLGDSILISPVLIQGARFVDAFFPQGWWYNWYDFSLIEGTNVNVTLDAPLEHVNVHIRAGRIIPTQHAGMTTTETRSSDYTLIVAADKQGTAVGKLYVDDGETFDTPSRWLDVNFSDRSLWICSRSGSYEIKRPLTKLVLLGILGVRAITVNGIAVNSVIEVTSSSTIVTGLSVNLNRDIRIALL
ncbi:hypothetical protein H4S08_003272 [Coemansia sp. RSA 1365]|nr:hypothetical protein H4S08_003272 [Coemansia sp. RSA 1365]